MKTTIRTLALAAQVTDAVLFRALLAETREMERIPFTAGKLAQLADALNKALSFGGEVPDSDLVTAELLGPNVGLLKNARGLVVKIENKDGRCSIDSYYSYPPRRGACDTRKARVGYLKIKTSAAGARAAKRAADFPNVKAAATLTAAERSDRHFVRVAQIVTAALCMMFGVLIVQVAFVNLIGHIGVDYASVFGSIFVGLVLYAIIGEFFLHKALRNYGERQGFGEGGKQYDIYLIAFSMDAALHGLVYAFMPHTPGNALVVCASVVFFIFPGTYFVTTLWNMKREVVAINRHSRPVSRRYYTNSPIEAAAEDLLPVTISIAVYLEDNDVIFDNLRDCLAAADDYRSHSGKAVNIVLSDDGLMKLCGGEMTAGSVAALLARYMNTPGVLSAEEFMAAERIAFCRRHGIAFVARPLDGRPGKFKKGGNLNFSYRLAKGEALGGYSEGEIVFRDIILTLDKDSGFPPGVITAAVPEFVRDPKLAYAQGLTEAKNRKGNYFTRVMCRYFFMLQNTGLSSKSLMGLSTPLMGHNAFLRRSFMEESGLWAEDRVSEDLAKAIDANRMGYHGKYLAFEGLSFTEYVSDTFIEETGKQLRYCYGLTEILMRSFREVRQLKGYHWCDLGSYFCSYINIAAIIPTYLILLRFDIFHLLFGGIIVNAVIYFLIGVVLASKVERLRSPVTVLSYMGVFAVVGLTFFAHNYSVMRAFFEFAADRIRIAAGKAYAAFPASSVRTLDGSFRDGWNLLYPYYRRNIPVVILAVIFAINGIRMLGWIDTFVPAVVLASVAQLLYAAAVPALTPQLFGRLRGTRKTRRAASGADAAEQIIRQGVQAQQGEQMQPNEI
ncbi:MAG: hypothetical protein LBS85_01925 [Clostridiales Family XIII bacterium]|nr:hypothetical protein [Clostridiales Family XIII bacterium]